MVLTVPESKEHSVLGLKLGFLTFRNSHSKNLAPQILGSVPTVLPQHQRHIPEWIFGVAEEFCGSRVQGLGGLDPKPKTLFIYTHASMHTYIYRHM